MSFGYGLFLYQSGSEAQIAKQPCESGYHDNHAKQAEIGRDQKAGQNYSYDKLQELPYSLRTGTPLNAFYGSFFKRHIFDCRSTPEILSAGNNPISASASRAYRRFAACAYFSG